MSRRLLLSCLFMLGSGCATLSAQPPSNEPVFPLGQQGGEPLRVQGGYLTGPNSSLIISDNGMRGRYLDMPVFLSWTWQELTGSVSHRATRLELAEGDDIHVQGFFGGVRVNYVLGPDWLVGRVGTCEYVLRRFDAGFIGRRGCGGPLEPDLRVLFPAPLMERPLGEKTALLMVALVNSMDTYSPITSMDRRRPPMDHASAPPTVTRYSP